MDSFDKTVEKYKQELMKYARKNGAVYGGISDGFRQARKTDEPKHEHKKYSEKYVSNRPMPPEYFGEDNQADEAVSVSVDPQMNDNRNPVIERLYADYNDFIGENSKSGKLRVQTYASTQVFPVQNARVTVEKQFENGNHIFADSYTDTDGIVENIILPTKSRTLSLTPEEAIPYTTYTIRVSHPNFAPIVFRNVPIFEAIESFQPVAMLPLGSPSAFGNVDEAEQER